MRKRLRRLRERMAVKEPEMEKVNDDVVKPVKRRKGKKYELFDDDNS